jgi:hypothetical protein
MKNRRRTCALSTTDIMALRRRSSIAKVLPK